MASKWKVTKVSDLLSIKHGFAFKGEYFTDEETEYQLTTPGNFSISGGFQDIKPKYYDGPIPSDYVLSPGQIIVTMTDLSKKSDTLGFAAVIPNDEKTWLHNQRVGLVQIHDLEACNAVFINYLFRTHEYRSWVIGSATGTTVKHTSPSRITSYEFLLPPLAEQQAIAHILGTLDDKIEINRQMNETLEAMAQALFKSWFVDFDPVIDNALLAGNDIPDELAERAELRQAQLNSGKAKANSKINDLFPSEFEFTEELGWIPKGWGVSKIEKEYETVGGGTPSTKISEFWEDGDIHWTTPKDLSGQQSKVLLDTDRKITELGLAKISSGLLPVNTVLMSSRAPVGYLALAKIPVAINQGYIAFKCNKTLTSEYAIQWAESEMAQIKQRAGGTTFSEISKSNFRDIDILVPSSKLVERYSAAVKSIYDKVTVNEKQSNTLAKLRDTLLPKLMSGELRIADAEKLVAEII